MTTFVMPYSNRMLTFLCISLIASSVLGGPQANSAGTDDVANAQLALGRAVFADKSLSADGQVSCQTCHIPSRAYADSRATSVGVHGRLGTRNAPSLVGIADDNAFFWDGRRNRIEDLVLDAFTNPVELGLPSNRDLLLRLEHNAETIDRFRRAFPSAKQVPTLDQTRLALTSFVRSLSPAKASSVGTTSSAAESGKRLFEGIAGCSGCHASKGSPNRFSDGMYHHSSVSPPSLTGSIPPLVREVVEQSLNVEAIGPKVLTDAEWSSLGRFVVTQRPNDIAAFRTPSLRNVALTPPYMHDGSVATLAEAVDRELFYRTLANGRVVNLSASERKELVAYLEALSDAPTDTR